MIQDNSAIAAVFATRKHAAKGIGGSRASGKSHAGGKSRAGEAMTFETLVAADRSSTGSAGKRAAKAGKRRLPEDPVSKRESAQAPPRDLAAGESLETSGRAMTSRKGSKSGAARHAGAPSENRTPLVPSADSAVADPGKERAGEVARATSAAAAAPVKTRSARVTAAAASGSDGAGRQARGAVRVEVVSGEQSEVRPRSGAEPRSGHIERQAGPAKAAENTAETGGQHSRGPARNAPGKAAVADAPARKVALDGAGGQAGRDEGGHRDTVARPSSAGGTGAEAAVKAKAGLEAGRRGQSAARAESRETAVPRAAGTQRRNAADVRATGAGAPAEGQTAAARETGSRAQPGWAVTTREFAGETALRISMMLRQDPGSEGLKARIRLEPEALGQVEVDLEVGKGLKIRLTAHQEAGFTAIKQELGQLRTALEARGLALEDLSLDLAAGDTGSRPEAGGETAGHERHVTVHAAIEKLTPAAGGIALALGGGGILNIVV